MLLSDVTTGGCYNRKLLLLSCPAEQLLQPSKCRPLRKQHSRCQTGKIQKIHAAEIPHAGISSWPGISEDIDLISWVISGGQFDVCGPCTAVTRHVSLQSQEPRPGRAGRVAGWEAPAAAGCSALPGEEGRALLCPDGHLPGALGRTSAPTPRCGRIQTLCPALPAPPRSLGCSAEMPPPPPPLPLAAGGKVLKHVHSVRACG
nr:espin-like isoform X1 [Columba livia]XP_021141274.1 espin-like isoform X1 [Columba livia]